MALIGTHCILDLQGCSHSALDSQGLITQALKDAADAAGATLLSLKVEAFDPHGLTAVALLAESHIAIHTWPELGYAAVDVFTCGPTCDPQAACHSLVKSLGAESHEIRVLKRGPQAIQGQEDPTRLPRPTGLKSSA